MIRCAYRTQDKNKVRRFYSDFKEFLEKFRERLVKEYGDEKVEEKEVLMKANEYARIY